jgi:FtsP/CotA-like multicopper oxidase with cupredoxin domain
MDTIIRRKLMISALLLVVAVLFGAVLCSERALAALPPSPCISDGAGTTTCDLWATTGSITLPDGVVVTTWGYTDTAAVAASVPGPMLIVNQGETVVVNLHNDLAEATALLIDEQAMMPDLVGAAPGATKTYTVIASAPGTYLYEAGLLPNAQHQVAMGMYGAFIVRPAAAAQAYDDPATAFDDEALLVLGEIDPVLNNSADLAAFDMRDFMPKYWLINGQAYPNTVPVTSTAGNTVLLRYVNAGLQHHSMTVLGLGQTVIGVDGSPLAHPYRIVADSFAPGQTADVTVTLSISTPVGSKFPLYDGDLALNNNGAAGFGGMLTFLEVGVAPPPPGAGPATTGVTLVPNPTNGLVDVALSASIAAGAGLNVSGAEYFIDSPGADGTGTAMNGAFGSATVAVDALIPQAVVGALPAGNHLVYVHGQDDAGTWGSFNFGTLQIEKGGPATRGLSLRPNPTNGSVDVALTATGDTTASGNGNVTAAEYFIDTQGGDGSGVAMTVNFQAPVASLDAMIPAATLPTTEGPHPVYVHAKDDQGNWGPAASIDVLIDLTGPATSGVTAAPNPTNGTRGVNSNVAAVRVTATINDAASNVKTAEGFIDAPGTNGTGFPFIAVDALFDSPMETAYADIPLSTIALLNDGPHSILVHGKDAAGNWGPVASFSLLVDKTGPVVTVSATPNPTNGTADNNTSFVLSATATDAWTNIVVVEWFEGADPGLGNGNGFTFTAGNPVNPSATIDFMALGWAPGNHTVYVRARDAAGNWGAAASVVVTIVYPNNIFADGFDLGNFNAWSATGGTAGQISVTSGNAQAGTYKMQAQVAQGTSGYVQDNTPAAETSYHARFYFNPNNVNIGGTARTIFSGLNATNQTVFLVQVRRTGGNSQVSAVVSRAGGTTTTNWFNMSNNAYTAIEIAWASGNPASFSLYTGGTLRQTLTGLNTSAFTLDTVQLGPQGALNGLNVTAWYFDSFVSRRRTVIGP